MVCYEGKIFNSVSYTMLQIGAYRERVIFSCPYVSWVDFRRYLILIFVGNMTFHCQCLSRIKMLQMQKT